MIGVHHGSACIFENWTNSTVAKFNVTDGILACKSEGNFYRIFTAWENAMAVLNLQ